MYLDEGNWTPLHDDLFAFLDTVPSRIQMTVYRMAVDFIRRARREPGFVATESGRVDLAPGQLVVGRRTTSKAIGLSEQEFRTALSFLSESGFLTHQPTRHCTVVTVLDITRYRPVARPSNPQSNPDLTRTQPTPNPDLTTNQDVQIDQIGKQSGAADNWTAVCAKFLQLTTRPAVRANGNYEADKRKALAIVAKHGLPWMLQQLEAVCVDPVDMPGTLYAAMTLISMRNRSAKRTEEPQAYSAVRDWLPPELRGEGQSGVQ